jgi:hypothetical protein
VGCRVKGRIVDGKLPRPIEGKIRLSQPDLVKVGGRITGRGRALGLSGRSAEAAQSKAKNSNTWKGARQVKVLKILAECRGICCPRHSSSRQGRKALMVKADAS